MNYSFRLFLIGLFSIFFYQAQDNALLKIFHQSNYQKAQKRVAKVYYMLEQWQEMSYDDRERSRSSFSLGLWHYLLNYFFYTKTIVAKNKTKVSDLAYLLNLQRNISNSISQLDIADDRVIASKLILIEADALISNLLSSQFNK